MYNEKLNAPKGVGVGSLFSGLIREIIPVSKSTIKNLNKVMDNNSMKLIGKTLQKEATNMAVNDTLNYLNQKKIKKSKRKQLKKVAKNILSLSNKKKSLSQPKKTRKKKSPIATKRKLKNNRGPKNKKPLFDDDY